MPQATVSSFQSTKFTGTSGAAPGLNVQPGNALYVFVGHAAPSVVTSVTDNAGNGYVLVGGQTSQGGSYRLDVYVANPANGGTNVVVTVNVNTSVSVAFDVINVTSQGATDQIGAGNSANSTTPNASVLATKPQPQELVLLGVVVDTTSPPISASGGDSLVVNQPAPSIFSTAVFQNSVNGGTANLSSSVPITVNWGALAISIGPSTSGGGGGGGGGGGTPTPPPPPPPPPGSSPGVGVNATQSGNAAKLTCVTRAVKNAKVIQKLNPLLTNPTTAQAASVAGFNQQFVIPQVEPAAGFFSIVPLSGPSSINKINPMNGYGLAFSLLNPSESQPIALSPFAASVSPSSTGSGEPSNINGALFDGIIHIMQVTYSNSNSSFVMSTADLQTLQNFLQHAIKQIQQYAAQYGPCSVAIDTNINTVTLTLSGSASTFNDATLCGNPNSSPPTSGLVDSIASANKWTNGAPTAHCVMIIAPPGVTNTDCDPNNGMLGYHSASAVNNVPYIYVPVTQNGLTTTDTADVYQVVASHETAELMVDPAANLANPEVCDQCGPNCQPLYRDFFDQNDNYLGTQTFFPPIGLSYAYMINAIVTPSYAGGTNCPTPSYACAYSPNSSQNFPAPQVPGQLFPPGFPGVPFVAPSGAFNLIFPGGVDIGQLAPSNPLTSPGNFNVIKLPLPGFGS